MSDADATLQAPRNVTRHYSTSGPRPTLSLNVNSSLRPALSRQASSNIQALDLCPTTRVDLPSALTSLRVHVLSYLSDLETRLTLLHFKSQSTCTSPTTLQSPGPLALRDRDGSEGPPASPTKDSDVASVDIDDIALDSEDVANFIKQGFELLQTIRADVCSFLPEYPDFVDSSAASLRSRLHELGTQINTQQLTDKLHDFEMPSMSMEGLRQHLPHLPDLGRSLSDFDFSSPDSNSNPMSYIPRLKAHLASLQEHMSAELPSNMPLPSSLHPPAIISELLADLSLLSTDNWQTLKADLQLLKEGDSEEAIQADERQEKVDKETMQGQVLRALERSRNGAVLIQFTDLPSKWRNNEFVQYGYRFIPSTRWPALLYSVFQVHNETTNIHTHLLPLLTLIPILCTLASTYIIPNSFASFTALSSKFPAVAAASSSFSSTSSSASSFLSSSFQSSSPLLPYISPVLPYLAALHAHIQSLRPYIPALLPHNPSLDALPAAFFTFSAAACLLLSCAWHISAGCSDLRVMEAAARGDYVGIGWLISASVQTVVFYGFRCQDTQLRVYTALCMLTGLAGSVIPFQGWFNERRNKKWRIVFFLGLCFASLLPLTHLSIAKGPLHTLGFVKPVLTSCLLYITGLLFYATHFPESFFARRGRRFDLGCSHALWHIFIVLAIRSHYVGLGKLKEASGGFSCGL